MNEIDKNIETMNQSADYDLSKLEIIGTGGEHIVYGVDDGKNVLKVNFHSFEKPSPEEIRRKNENWLQLRRHFDDHIPLTETVIKIVQFDESFIEKVEEENEDLATNLESDTPIATEVTVQERIDLGDNQVTLKINGFHNVTEESVDRLKNSFEYTDSGKDYEEEILQDYQVFEELFKKIDQDEELRGQVADFTSRLIKFTEKTGESIDLGGADNVIFYETENGDKDYVLIDAIMLDSTNFTRQAERFQRWLEGDREGTNIQDVSPHDIQYLRGLNALAWKTGIEDRVTQIGGQDIQPYIDNVTNYLKTQV